MFEAQILASLSLWTNSSCCRENPWQCIKGKRYLWRFFFSQDHSSVIHFEADLNWETCFRNLVAGLKTHRFQGTAYLLRSTQIAHDKLSDTRFTIIFLCLCLPPTPLLNLFPEHLTGSTFFKN